MKPLRRMPDFGGDVVVGNPPEHMYMTCTCICTCTCTCTTRTVAVGMCKAVVSGVIPQYIGVGKIPGIPTSIPGKASTSRRASPAPSRCSWTRASSTRSRATRYTQIPFETINTRKRPRPRASRRRASRSSFAFALCRLSKYAERVSVETYAKMHGGC